MIKHAQNQGQVSPFCPNVLTGCAHSMAMDEEGVGVACVEWADAHGIQWIKEPKAGVSLTKTTDGEPVADTDAGHGFVAGWSLPGWVWRDLLRNNPCALVTTFTWFAPKTPAPHGLPEGELS